MILRNLALPLRHKLALTPRLSMVAGTLGLCVALYAAAPAPSAAQTPPRPAAKAAPAKSDRELVAVLDLEPIGTTKTEAVAISERLREEMLRSGRITLVDRGQMNAIMDEQALQQTGCTSQECAVQVGKVLGVRKLVSGKVIKLGELAWQVSVTMVDVETAETVKAESLRHRGDLFSLTDQPIATLAAKFTGPPIAPPAGSPPVQAVLVPPVPPQPQAAPPAPAIPARKWAPGEPLRVAVFPIQVFGANLLSRFWWFEAIDKGVKRVPNTEITHTWYPGNTPGQPITNDSNLPDRVRAGFSKSPDFPAVQAKGKQLGVDAVLMVNHQTGNPGHVSAWLVDVNTGHVSEQKYDLDANGDALTLQAAQGVADVIQKMRDGM